MERPRKIIPPVYMLFALAVMSALHVYLPIARILHPPYTYAGAVLIAAGLLMSITAAGSFRKVGTPVIPFERSTVLVTTGMFRYTRNPMYLGLMLILVGVWIVFGSLSPGLPILAFLWIIQRNFILGEERFLEEIFGQQYLSYKGRVRRWI